MNTLAKIKGSLLAGACGDALGYPVEFLSGGAIRRQHGDSGVREMELRNGVALFSDDTQMTLFTAEGMLNALRHGEDVTACVYESYLDWLNTQYADQGPGKYGNESRLLRVSTLHSRRAPGNTCLSALCYGRMGTHDAPLNRSKGCGGVMRIAPAGMLRLMDADDPEDAYALQGAAFSVITHGHPLGWLPGAMLADMVRLCLREPEKTLLEITEASLQRLCGLWGEKSYFSEFETLVRKAIQLAGTDTPDELSIGKLGGGWVGDEALAIALYCCLRHPDNMEDCLSAAVSHGGDSDSTGAIAGNLLGAYLGEEAIPARWLECLEAREVIEDIARQLAEAGA